MTWWSITGPLPPTTAERWKQIDPGTQVSGNARRGAAGDRLQTDASAPPWEAWNCDLRGG